MSRPTVDIEARKRQLILEGQIYRLEAAQAKAQVTASMTAQALAKDALGHVGSAAASAGGKFLLNAGVTKILLPLGVAGLSALRRLRSWRTSR